MRGTRGHSARRFGALAIAAGLMLLAFPTTAFAQIGDKVDQTVDETTDAVDGTVDSVEETVDGAGGSEGGTVDQTTDTVDRINEDTGETLDTTTDTTTDTVDDAVKGRISPLDEPLKKTAARVGALVDSILGGPGNGRGRGRNDGGRTDPGPREANARRPSAGIDGFSSGAASAPAFATSSRTQPVSSLGNSSPVAGPSPVEQLIQSITDVLPRVAFPIALLILVAAFLVIQGRVDRSDPKLALAPIDVEQEYLSFR